MNWGYRITILTLSFVAFMTFLVVQAFKQNFDLVAEDYYAKEIKYQDRIESQKNQAAMEEDLTCMVLEDHVVLKFPNAFNGRNVEGEIHFFRPSDAEKDVITSVAPSAGGVQVLNKELLSKGFYRVQVDYKVDGKPYYFENTLMVQ